MGKESDFVVDSNHLCFVCLKRAGIVHPPKDTLKQESGAHEPDRAHFPIFSLKSLSRFFGMDLKKVFKSQSDISPHLLNKVDQAALKAELCDNCSGLVSKFSQLYQQFEKIKIALMSCLQDIHEKLLDVDEEEVTEEFISMEQGRKHPITNSNDEWLDKLDILKILRMQAIEKSSSLIGSSTPRIKLENLTMKEIGLKKLKIKQKSTEATRAAQSASKDSCCDSETLEIRIEKIKEESLAGSSICNDDDMEWDDISNYPDNAEIHGEDETSSDQSEAEPIVAEMKVDTHDTHNVKVTEMTSLLSPHTRPSAKLAKMKGFNPVKINGKYQCNFNFCKKHYKTWDGAFGHFNSVHLKLRYKCGNCEKEFVTQHSYEGHHRAAHQNAGLKCNNCKRHFVGRHNLERHQLLNRCTFPNGKKRHGCQLCDKSYGKMRDLRAHVNAAHLKSSRYSCNQCAKIFIKSSHLNSHIKSVHLGIKEHRCSVCSKSYVTKSNLNYHKFKVHT